MSEFAVKTENVYKSYQSGPQKVEVLKGVNLEVRSGEVAVIMGPSGVGKSTLLHIVGMLDRSDSGRLWIRGQDVSELDKPGMARMRNDTIGFVFQFHHLLPEFSALENVLIPSMIRDEKNADKAYALELLERVGLKDRMSHKPRELSGGERQRVAVARALINKPQIVLADEPTGNLDKLSGEALYHLLLELNRELGQTLLIVTHNEHMAENAHRLITMDDGIISGQQLAGRPKS
ncbi:MAG TPA: ABC transporter ATP-binding protein [Caldithrix abyssi]|uniref:ABC transporter ATP-binding protein n=1 Tax=Caldithrix abyssi TaxID=187145 RepID=A0A7V1LPA6_CALAY|nr:ABC transporter ATP-binding protein [Caldithrix abyssi]